MRDPNFDPSYLIFGIYLVISGKFDIFQKCFDFIEKCQFGTEIRKRRFLLNLHHPKTKNEKITQF